MTDQAKQKLKYWIIGLFSGGAVAAPITAYICKNVYEKRIDEAETRGMNEMAAYAVQQQQQVVQSQEETDINNYDLSFDGDDDVETEEAQKRTLEHERYLDMIDKYNGNTDIQPHIISAEEYINEQYMEKSNVNWYEQDNVFEEDLNVIEDPFSTFGVTDGHELFRNADLRPDPDICYVRNERITTDFEISRIHGSYADIVGGESVLGETDT